MLGLKLPGPLCVSLLETGDELASLCFCLCYCTNLAGGRSCCYHKEKITHDKKATGQSIVKQSPGLMLFPAEAKCLQESSGNIHVRGLGGKYILLVLKKNLVSYQSWFDKCRFVHDGISLVLVQKEVGDSEGKVGQISL